MTSTPIGPGAEFDIVRAVIARLGDSAGEIGDDAGPFRAPPGEQLLVSTDLCVENVHFRAAWLSAREIGYRAVMAALSDLAAMGATPRAIVVAWILPESWRSVTDQLGDGIGEAARECGVQVVGGDLSSGPVLALGVTVIGSARQVLRRAGARPGDAIFVTGRLGGSRLALNSFEANAVLDADVRARFVRPTARIREGAWLAAHGATAAIDISDGLVADLAHLAAASGVRVQVDVGALPLFARATPELAATSGEEYEIACAAPPSLDTSAFQRQFGIALTRIGTVDAGAPAVEARRQGVLIPLPRGYNHFVP